MNVAERLETARADLASLERHSAKLESNLAAQEAELDRVRRAARAGGAEFEAVVEQQNRVTAARGLLEMHLRDLAHTAALVDELEGAHGLAELIAEGRTAQAEAARLAAEYAQKARQTEALIQSALDDLQALQGAYSAALTRVLGAATGHTSASLGLGHNAVMQAVTRTDSGPPGAAGAAYRRRVTDALADFAGEVETSPQALQALIRREVPELIAGGSYPLLGRLNRA